MPSQPIELILLRQWASYIAIPMWITDAEGNLLFYNEPAEAVLGQRFEDSGPINAKELSHLFVTTDLEGNPIPAEELPIGVALVERIPAHRDLRIKGLDGSERTIEVTSFPIIGEGDRMVGALAAFWELA